MRSMLVAAAISAGYATLHSLLLTRDAERVARRAFGPAADRWYRLSYNALAVLLLAVHDAALTRLPDRAVYAFPSGWRRPLSVARAGAFVGLAACLRLTDAATYLGLRQAGLLPAYRRPLVQRGPYGSVRHPTVWCVLGILWLVTPMTRNRLASNVVFTLYLATGSLLEERRLVREFGSAYLAYRERVPRLLPRHHRLPDLRHHSRRGRVGQQGPPSYARSVMEVGPCTS